MVRRRPGETDRAYLARLRRIIAAAGSPAEVLTPEEETRRAIRPPWPTCSAAPPTGT